jgi:hypothetical protein
MVLLIIAKNICRDGVSDCQELYCTHEEADTRMILQTSQEMINDSVAQSIRQEIVPMLVCWQRLQETFSNQESVGLL